MPWNAELARVKGSPRGGKGKMKKKGGKSKKGRKEREEAGFFLPSWLVFDVIVVV